MTSLYSLAVISTLESRHRHESLQQHVKRLLPWCCSHINSLKHQTVREFTNEMNELCQTANSQFNKVLEKLSWNERRTTWHFDTLSACVTPHSAYQTSIQYNTIQYSNIKHKLTRVKLISAVWVIWSGLALNCNSSVYCSLSVAKILH